jgi:excisionase family DNA binding protein
VTSNVVRLPLPEPVQDSPGASEQPAPLPLLIPVPVAAKLLGIPRSSAYRLAETGELPTRRLGGRVYVITAKLYEIVEAA